MNNFLCWLDARFPILECWKKNFTEYYVPKNLNVYYLFGVFALVVLAIQFITGLWLTMFYTPDIGEAFASIEAIMRDVNYGWLLRYMHTTGASFFFIVVYLHVFKALLYGSYQKPRELLWLFGMALYGLLVAQAFFGYVLPWGQMSYWGATVITDLLSVIPYVGESLVTWIRGDYSVGNPTLHRFFALHIIGVPLLLLFFVFFHLVALRRVGSNNPEGIEINNQLDKQGKPLDGLPFYPYFVIKDVVGVTFFLMLFFAVVFFMPDFGGYFLEPENFSPANPLVTPDHIAPVWYMAPFYAILRVIPNKLLGVLLMGGALFLLICLPWLDKSPVKSMRYKGMYSKIALVGFVFSVMALGYLGRATLTPCKQFFAQIAIIFYFAYFLLMPIYTRYEQCKTPPDRIGIAA